MRSTKKNKRVKQRTTDTPPIILDEFATSDIALWTQNTATATYCANAVHFDLERQRVLHRNELLQALQSVNAISMELTHWVRVVDYRWSLQPLSSIGSIQGIGGRFNYGKDLTVVRRQEFPCVYLASDKLTAYCERFGGQPEETLSELQRQEYSLRHADVSFTTFDINGRVNQIFDLRKVRNLDPFVTIISKFAWTKSTKDCHTKFKMRLPPLIRESEEMHKRILTSPNQWRLSGNVWGIPASNQIFGWFLREAGFEGVLYPSQQGGNDCLAIFPENLKSSDSTIEVTGPNPTGATCTRLDRNNLCLPPR